MKNHEKLLKISFQGSKPFFLLIALSFAVYQLSFGQEIFVSYYGFNIPGNGTLQNPYKTVTYALNNVSLPNTTIKCFNNHAIEDNIVWPLNFQYTTTIVKGWDPVNNTDAIATIDGVTSGSVLNIYANNIQFQVDNTNTFKNLIFTNGYSPKGGGIYMEGYVAPTFDNVSIRYNTAASEGGGVYYNPYMDYIFNPVNNCYEWQYSNPCQFINSDINLNTAGIVGQGGGLGGGIYIQGIAQGICPNCALINTISPSLQLNQTLVQGNHANGPGGGIFATSAYLEISGGGIDENTSNAMGGGLFLKASKSKITGSMSISANSATQGGGIFIVDGVQLKINNNDCIFPGLLAHEWSNDVEVCFNEASESGGGIYFDNSALDPNQFFSFQWTSGYMHHNISQLNGGAIYFEKGGILHLKDIKFIDNAAGMNGGAIYNNCVCIPNPTGNGEPGTLNHDFTQLLLVKNRAGKGYGGAIFTRQTFYCINSTIADNYLGQDLCGGAIACFPWYNSYGSPQAVTPVFFNSILWNNTTGLLPTQNQIYLHADQCNPFFATCDIQNFNSLSSNDFVLNGTPNTLTGSAWSPTLINPIILDDPQFVDATNYDYRIDNYPLSLCKNVGTGNLSIPALCLGFGTNYFGFPWTNDIRGNTFIRDFESLIDIGAYEIQGIDPAPPRLAPFSTEADARLEESSFNIMPNPVPLGQIAFLNILCPDSVSAEIEIIDFTGNCIHSAKLTGNGKTAEKVNTQGLSKACYLIRLTFKDKNARMFTRSKKLIIM